MVGGAGGCRYSDVVHERALPPGARAERGRSPSSAARRQPSGGLVALQRQAGNRAVCRLPGLGPQPTLVVQRHSSWEHALLGDTPPARLADATVRGEHRNHLLSREWSRVQAFGLDPAIDPRGRFPEYRWLQLAGSRLWITYGELNALADYLPDPQTIDTLPTDRMVPVLQRMRASILGSIKSNIGLPAGAMAGQAWSGLDFVPGAKAAGEVSALDSATAGLGVNRYQGLLARNACHFAPMSWQRWALYHNQAREEALTANGGRCRDVPLRDDVTAEANRHERSAWMNNGYGDHFLQDSFAAGHLVNKTLVMQWFAEHLADLPYFHWSRLISPIIRLGPERPDWGVPDRAELRGMSEGAQPGIAGRHLYGAPLPGRTSAQDRATGDSALDPQTAQERGTVEGRMAGSGVAATNVRTREEAYQLYLQMLNSSYLQLAAGAVHDWFNERGLSVGNANGDRMNIGGDETLLDQSGRLGAHRAAEAAHLSQQAISELLNDGATAITVEQIFELVPTSVYVSTEDGERQLSLEQFQDEVVHDLCRETIFPQVVRALTSDVVRHASPDMVEGGVSQDVGALQPR
jgi:hypothetical protein